MNLRSLKPGDTVEVNIKGRVFPALFVGATPDGRVDITPVDSRWSYHNVRKIDVKRRLARA